MSITFSLKNVDDEEFELNLSNGNAFDFQRALLPIVEPDFCGEWKLPELRHIQANLMRLLNTKAGEALQAPTVEDSTPGMCRMVIVGRDADYVQLRLKGFMCLVNEAIKRKTTIVFG